MLEKPQIVHTLLQTTAVIHLTVPRAEIRHVMGPGLGELMETISAQGIEPVGAWFSHHLRLDPAIFDFELGVPVQELVSPAGRVRAGWLPAALVARAIYRGGYEGLGEAWGELVAWIVAQGHTPADELWECYLEGPESGSNPANWRTELCRPLIT